MIIIQVIFSRACLLNKAVASWDRDVVCDSNIGVSAPSNLDFVIWLISRIGLSGHWSFHFLSVDDIKYFLWWFGCQRFEDYEILIRLLHIHNIDNLVVVGNFERKILLAQFAVELFKFEYDLLTVYFASWFCIQPATQTLQMNLAHGSCTVTRWDQGIDIVWVFWLTHVIFAAPTDTTYLLTVVRMLSQLLLLFLFYDWFNYQFWGRNICQSIVGTLRLVALLNIILFEFYII